MLAFNQVGVLDPLTLNEVAAGRLLRPATICDRSEKRSLTPWGRLLCLPLELSLTLHSIRVLKHTTLSDNGALMT